MPLAARQEALRSALSVAESALKTSPLLSRMNSDYGRNTLLLHLTKYFWRPQEYMIIRIMVAASLASQEKAVCKLILHRQAGIDIELLPYKPQDLQILLCGGDSHHAEMQRNLRLVLVQVRLTRSIREKGIRRDPEATAQKSAQSPAVLLLQEDELATDPSYRTQPHWLYSTPGSFSAKIYILPLNTSLFTRHNPSALQKWNIEVFPPGTLVTAALRFVFRKPERPMLLHGIMCVLASCLSSSRRQGHALWTAGLLLFRAGALSLICDRNNIGAFVTTENHTPESDAMQIVAELRSVRTLSYQYSNLGIVNPIMMTTADEMLTFSSAFYPLTRYKNIGPRRTTEVGYVYDSSFSLVADRAARQRGQLLQAGAQFVICYFDENVQAGKYGIFSTEEHHREIMQLIQLVLEDSSIGLVIKTKLNRSVPTQMFPTDHRVSEAIRTGRYTELRAGVHRNNILASEAAQMSDFCIGHSIGGTATLEAALVGKRAVLLNPYGFRTIHEHVYQRANVIFPSMSSVIAAIDKFRNSSGQEDLGDWSGVIAYFDRYHDGRAAQRLKERIEAAVSGDHDLIASDSPKVAPIFRT